MFYLGGQRITKTGWLGPAAVYVDFITTYSADWLFQLYVNRTLVGQTVSPLERRIVGALVPSDSPAVLTLLRVDAINGATDYGQSLPPGPWNRYALEWDAASYPADADHFEITGSTEAGGAVDPANVLANVECFGDGSYRFVLPAFETAGVWTYTITPRDDAIPSGNAGTGVDVAITMAVPPPDLVMDGDGQRFSVSITGGVLTAAFEFSS